MKGNPPGRRCAFRKPDGTACRAKPLHKIDLCFWQDPEHKEEAHQYHSLTAYVAHLKTQPLAKYQLPRLSQRGG